MCFIFSHLSEGINSPDSNSKPEDSTVIISILHRANFLHLSRSWCDQTQVSNMAHSKPKLVINGRIQQI